MSKALCLNYLYSKAYLNHKRIVFHLLNLHQLLYVSQLITKIIILLRNEILNKAAGQ